MNLREKAALAEKAARASGEMLQHQSHFKVMRKSTNDFVTEMDFKSESLIRDILLSACPEDEFFGEESGGATNCLGRWIVDPIDGTANYMRGQPLYTISIAYEYRGELVVGCVYCPPTDELFLAVRDEGATRNGQPIHVSNVDDTKNALIHLAFGHRDEKLRTRTLNIVPKLLIHSSDLRRSGSCAYDMCSVAAGHCDGFVELGLSLYDYAAGYVILTEAGGKLTAWDLDEDPIATGNLLASNGILHEAIRALVTE